MASGIRPGNSPQESALGMRLRNLPSESALGNWPGWWLAGLADLLAGLTRLAGLTGWLIWLALLVWLAGWPGSLA